MALVCPLCRVRRVSVGVGGDVWCCLCGEPEYAFVCPVDNSVDNFVAVSESVS